MADEPRRPDGEDGHFWQHVVFLVIGALLAYIVIGVGLWLLLNWQVGPEDSTQKKDLVQAQGYMMAGLAGTFAGVAAIIGVYVTWQNLKEAQKSTEENLKRTDENLRLTRKGLDETRRSTNENLAFAKREQIAERFTRAIDQLGKEEAVRIGGIYALEKIAQEVPDDYYWTIIEIITSYIRKYAKRPTVDKALEALELDTSDEDYRQHQHPLPDVQAALYVLARRDHRLDSEEDNKFINLSHCDLRYADLRGVHLKKARLRYTNLEKAMLRKANFEEAILSHAILDETYLEGADLRRARLRKTTLKDARLHSNSKRHIDGANLLGATHLTDKQVEEAHVDEHTKLPNHLKSNSPP